MTERTFIKALNEKDGSGLSLRDLITHFLEFLEFRCEENERANYIDALSSIQSGGIRGAEIIKDVNEEDSEEEKESILIQPNIIASSVMAEGVDLHLNCRYIIHHDLCWNPSTLEQRTGRVDRIGAKAEKSGQPIHIFIPFISETQDEKMYKVVMDRERWFKVVMGENYSLDALSTEKLAARIPIPLTLAEELAFKLGV